MGLFAPNVELHTHWALTIKLVPRFVKPIIAASAHTTAHNSANYAIPTTISRQAKVYAVWSA